MSAECAGICLLCCLEKKKKKKQQWETQKHPIWLRTVDVRVKTKQTWEEQLVLLL